MSLRQAARELWNWKPLISTISQPSIRMSTRPTPDIWTCLPNTSPADSKRSRALISGTDSDNPSAFAKRLRAVPKYLAVSSDSRSSRGIPCCCMADCAIATASTSARQVNAWMTVSSGLAMGRRGCCSKRRRPCLGRHLLRLCRLARCSPPGLSLSHSSYQDALEAQVRSESSMIACLNRGPHPVTPRRLSWAGRRRPFPGSARRALSSLPAAACQPVPRRPEISRSPKDPFIELATVSSPPGPVERRYVDNPTC